MLSKKETIEKLNDIYIEVLNRNIDKVGVNSYAHKVMMNELSFNDIRDKLENSEEYLFTNMEKDIDFDDEKQCGKIVKYLYWQLLDREVDAEGLENYTELLKNKTISINDLKNTLMQSNEFDSSNKMRAKLDPSDIINFVVHSNTNIKSGGLSGATKLSDLENDVGFVPFYEFPNKLSQFTNDVGFVPKTDMPTNYTPSSQFDTGKKGQFAWDDDYLYVCVDTDLWKRSPLSTW